MNKIDWKYKLKRTPKSTWIYLGCLGVILVAVIICLFVAMHLCGYTLASWLAKFYGYVILVGAGIILLVVWWIWWKVRKK